EPVGARHRGAADAGGGVGDGDGDAGDGGPRRVGDGAGDRAADGLRRGRSGQAAGQEHGADDTYPPSQVSLLHLGPPSDVMRARFGAGGPDGKRLRTDMSIKFWADV